jgi:hypothetical protein
MIARSKDGVDLMYAALGTAIPVFIKVVCVAAALRAHIDPLIGATSRLQSTTQHCHIACERVTSRWHAERVTLRAPIGHWLIL